MSKNTAPLQCKCKRKRCKGCQNCSHCSCICFAQHQVNVTQENIEKLAPLECNCRKARCPTCKQCSKCNCFCIRDRIRKRRRTSHQRSIQPSKPPPFSMSLRSKPKEDSSSNDSMHNSPKQARDSSSKENLDTPSIVHKIVIENESASRSETKKLALSNLRKTDEHLYASLDLEEELPRINDPQVIANIQPTHGMFCHSVGDLIRSFSSSRDIETELTRYNKQAGPNQLRAQCTKFDETHPKQFKFLASTAITWLQQISHIQYPADGKKLFDEVMNTMATKLNKQRNPQPLLSCEIVDKLNELYLKSGQRSLERRILGAVIEYCIPSQKLSRRTSDKRNEDIQSLLAGKSLTIKVESRPRRKEDILYEAVRFILQTNFIQTLSWGVKRIILDPHEDVIIPKVVRLTTIKNIYECYDRMKTQANAPKVMRIHSTLFNEITKAITTGDFKLISCVNYVTGNLLNDVVERLQEIIEYIFLPGYYQKKMSKNLTVLRHFLKVEYDRHILLDDGDGYHSLTHGLTKKSFKAPSKCRDRSCAVCSRTHPFLESNELSMACTTTLPNSKKAQVQCPGCKFPFYFGNELILHVRKAGSTVEKSQSTIYNDVDHNICKEAEQVVVDSMDKFLLYMKHRQRVQAQRHVIVQIENEMKEDARKREGRSRKMLVIIDFKMKFEALSARETMPENFGKRGMGWHGIAGIYYEWSEDLQMTLRKMFYVDQILENSNKQDAPCVATLIESFVVAVIANFGGKKKGEFVTSFAFCSDNAGCYVSKALMSFIPFLNAKYHSSVFIESLLHTETQDGKGIVDAHFSVASRHVNYFMKNSVSNKVRSIKTPFALAQALAWNNGLSNSIVQLVEVERSHVENIFALVLDPVAKKLSKYFSRASDVLFEHPSDDDASLISSFNESDWKNLAKGDLTKLHKGSFSFKIGVRAHSDYGKRIYFTISYLDRQESGKKKTNLPKVSVQVDANGINEYKIFMGIEQSNEEEEEGDNDDDDDDEQEQDRNEVYHEDSIEQDLRYEDGPDYEDADYDSDVQFFDDLETEDDNDIDRSSDIVSREHDLYHPDLDMRQTRIYQDPSSTNEIYQSCNFATLGHISRASNFPQEYIAMMEQKRSKNSKRKPSKDSNVQTEEASSKRADAFAVAVRFASKYAGSDAIGIRDCTKNLDDDYEAACSFDLNEKYLPTPGFARRKNDDGDEGDLFGARYMTDEYREIIQVLYERGNIESSAKMQPAQVYESIRMKFPNRFLIPSEYEVRTYMNSLNQKNKKQCKKNEEQKRFEPTRKNENIIPLDNDTVEWLMSHLMKNGNIEKSPLDLYKNALCVNFPHKFRIGDGTKYNRQISQLKKRARDIGWRQIV